MAAELKLAQCLRCKGYTLLGEDMGLAFAVDVAAVDRDAYIDAVVRRLGLYDVRKASGRPSKARTRSLASPAPSFTPEGAQEAAQDVLVHREHGCGAAARDQRPVKVDAGKASRPATPGVSRAGSPPPAARAGAARGRDSRSPATTATRRLSDRGVRCNVCRRLIDQEADEFTGIYYERWIWAVHEKCP